MGTRKIWWLKKRDPDSSSLPHAPMTFSRKVCGIEPLKPHGDGRTEISLCIWCTCQPFSKEVPVLQTPSLVQTTMMTSDGFLSSTFPFTFSIKFTQTCDMGDFEVHKAEPWKPQSDGKRNPCSIIVLSPFWPNGWWSESCAFLMAEVLQVPRWGWDNTQALARLLYEIPARKKASSYNCWSKDHIQIH